MTLHKQWPYIILILSFLAILIALIAEYIFNILPCKMCFYQRYSYYAIILFASVYIVLKKQYEKKFFIIIELLLIIGLFFSTWHVAIENNLISGPSGCSTNVETLKNIEDLREYILNRPLSNCNEINWQFLGISFAVYNSILQFILLVINSKLIFKND